MLAFGLRGDVRVVRSGSANGTKHLSSDLLWSTPDSVIHAVWLYSLWECILTSKRRRRSCPRRHLPADFLRFALVSIKNLKTHQFYYQIFWGPGPLTSLPMVRPPHGVHHPTSQRVLSDRISVAESGLRRCRSFHWYAERAWPSWMSSSMRCALIWRC